MKALKAFIAKENAWIEIFAGSRNAPTPMKMPTNCDECEPFFEELECKLSPENLCCDGEASAAHVRRETKRLQAVWKDLEAIRGSARSEYESHGMGAPTYTF